VKWKIYYSDGSTIGSENVTPWSLEKRSDVQVIVQESDEHNWVTRSGSDYYVWDSRGGNPKWFRADIFGLYDYLLKPGFKCVLFGIEIESKTFREIFNKARSEFGVKEAYEKAERHP